MTTPSLVQTLGLSISAFDASIMRGTSYDPRGTLTTDELAHIANGLTIEKSAIGGYTAASITIQDRQERIEEWIAAGLGRHIEIANPDGQCVWEGFVNQYEARLGPLAVSGGPVMDIVNRCTVIYTPIDTAADPPARGPQTETTTANDTDSQDRYGIIETVYSGGEATPSGAEQIRDTIIADRKDPQRSENVAVGSGSPPTVTLNCVGYYNFLDRYIYNESTTATLSISTKIQNALGADPNGLFSTDYDRIETNSFLVAAAERDNRTAWAIIKALAGIGNATDERTFFGIYNNRVAKYNSIQTSIEYQHRIADSSQRVEVYGDGALIRPWDVVPGQWVFLPDYLTGRSQPANDLRSDPRNVLVERVSYTAPYSVELNGQRFGKLPQLLAKAGLGGI